MRCFHYNGIGHEASQHVNKHTMIASSNVEYVSLSSDNNIDDMPPLEDGSSVGPANTLVIRLALSTQTNVNETTLQRNKICNTKATVKGKICNVIIDSGSYTNIASITLASKLKLLTIKHPRSFKLQWFNDYGKIKHISFFFQ